MATKDPKASCKGYPMVGGNSHHSYAQNSVYQKGAIDSTKELIHEAIWEFFDLKNPSFDGINTLKIADFGCSIGPNTFTSVDNIIESLELKFQVQEKEHPPIEFQVFFVDHTSNDFNTLFKNLNSSNPKYFSAGVPGSFHGRLFPNSSLHFAHSSLALHWLSRIPEELVDRNSSAWNKTSICCSGNVKEVAKAYSGQFKKHMDNFLSARAKELVVAGLLVIVVPGLMDGVLFSETHVGMTFDLLRSCLMDMASEGKFSEEKVEDFNVPFYYPSITELKEAVKRNGCFSIERTCTLNHPLKEKVPSVKFVTSSLRAIMQGVIKEWFGDEILDELFEQFAKKLSQNFFFANFEYRKYDEYFMLLKRNTNY